MTKSDGQDTNANANSADPASHLKDMMAGQRITARDKIKLVLGVVTGPEGK